MISNALLTSTGDGGSTLGTIALARAARVSKIGSRAGRVLKVIRMIRLIRAVKLYKLQNGRRPGTAHARAALTASPRIQKQGREAREGIREEEVRFAGLPGRLGRLQKRQPHEPVVAEAEGQLELRGRVGAGESVPEGRADPGEVQDEPALQAAEIADHEGDSNGSTGRTRSRPRSRGK